MCPLLLSVSLLLASCEGAQWNYQEGGHGPDHWTGVCASGMMQSPIDIRESEAIRADLGSWRFHNYEAIIKEGQMVNNGHTLKLSPGDMGGKIPSVSGGGLKNKYIFAQSHLHWGNTSVSGSEHTVNGAWYPLEMHLVHYNSKYADIGEAVAHEDGLAVIGIFFDISSSDNVYLQPLLEAGNKVKFAKQKTSLSQGISLKSLLPRNPETFYRYEGSLTTPGCNEIVTWSVFRDPVTVSEAQLDSLRSLWDSDNNKMGNNYRPVMPLNRRQVLVSGLSRSGHAHSQPQQTPEDPVCSDSSDLVSGVPGWAVVLISLAVALNVGVLVFLVSRRRGRPEHLKVSTEEH